MRKRTAQAETVVANIELELSTLPAIDAFGNCNAEGIAELEGWVNDLKTFINTGSYKADSEVGRWIDNWYSDVRCYE